jgi:NitT/TauT family transport system substrate-binding protein
MERVICRFSQRVAVALTFLALAAFLPTPAMADELEVSNYGVAENGFPYAVALAKGFFKEAGADITEIRGSSGGGTTIRNLLASGIAYGDVSLATAVAAILRGTDLKIIGQSSYATAVAWITMPNSPLKSIRDIRGKRLGHTNPQSTTEALNTILCESLGFGATDVVKVSTGGFGEGLALLEHGGIDAMAIGEPLLSKSRGKYRVLAFGRDVLPSLASDVAVTTGKGAREKAGLIRAIVAGRRKGVEFMNTHPKESAEIVAKAYDLPVDVVENIINNLLVKRPPDTKPYWVGGAFDYPAMDRMIRAQRLIGVIKEEVNWSRFVDESFLPTDLKSTR